MDAGPPRPRRIWLWLLVLLGGPLACCLGLMGFGFFAAKPPAEVVKGGVEPEGTCAFEGELRGMPSGAKEPYALTVSIASSKRAAAYPAEATDGHFRVAGVPCDDEDHAFSIAVTTADGLGGNLHSSLGGNSPALYAKSRARFEHVPIDLDRGLQFRGRVVDAAGAPLGGVRVSPVYQTYGRDGWAPPGVFTVTGKDGRFALAGVVRTKLIDGAPKVGLYVEGFPWKEVDVKLPANDDVVVELADLVLDK